MFTRAVLVRLFNVGPVAPFPVVRFHGLFCFLIPKSGLPLGFEVPLGYHRHHSYITAIAKNEGLALRIDE